MVIAVFLHLVRVFLTGAYKNGAGRGQRREWNWVIGVVMLLLTLFLSFTGYLLPWDQLAFWAVTVGTNIASSIPGVGPSVRELLIGGRTIEQATLIRFYVLHIVFLPLGLGVLFAYHMWRDPQGRRPGARRTARRRCEQPRPRRRSCRPRPTRCSAWPGARRRRSAPARSRRPTPRSTPCRTWCGARRSPRSAPSRVVSILSVFIASPLEEPANALVTPNPAKAPWYFLWLQEIVTDTTIRIGSFTVNGAFVGGVILPGLLIGAADRVALARPVAAPWPRACGFHGAARTQNIVFLLVVLVRRWCSPSSACSCAARTGTSTGRGRPGRRSRRGSDMEKRTNSPYPRHRPARAGAGRRGARHRHRALLWSDRAHDWRYYQVRVHGAWWPRQFGADKAPTVPTGLQQIWVADLGRADRCITCHQAISWKGFETGRAAVSHPPGGAAEDAPGRRLRLHLVPRRPGLGHRHRGRRTARWRTGRSRCSAATLGEAYSLADDKNALMQMNCNVCHRYDRETEGRRRPSTSPSAWSTRRAAAPAT